MPDTQRLLTIREAAELLKINPEVMRRWLRCGRVPGLKIGSDWRIRATDLAALVNPESQADASEPPRVAGTATGGVSSPQGPKMCIKSPKWLEYSGLPRQLNDEIGPQAWPVFKKLIEMDFEKGDEEDRRIAFDPADLSERVGYDRATVDRVLEALERRGHLALFHDRRQGSAFEINTPLRTPRLILDIPFQRGGIGNAPSTALQNRCMRRYLESPSPVAEAPRRASGPKPRTSRRKTT